jgi:glyoxylase-like metal-dependent hydrolase (beta-lactamase superfamily II)
MERRAGAGYAERNRFGRIGRIPTPTPFPVGDINTYLVFPAAGASSLTLIDTGVKSPEAFEALQHGFKAFGWTLEQLEQILITHAHMDHYGQARRIRDRSGATVYAPSSEAVRMRTHWSPTAERTEAVLAWFRGWGVPEEVARSDGGMAELAQRLQDPIEPDVLMEDGDRVTLGDLTLEVISTPGHCDGHVVFYERELRILFSGDHLLTDITPVPLLVLPEKPHQPRPKSLIRFMESLERVETLDCDLTLPAHGDAIADHRKLIAGYRLHHDRRALQMVRKLREAALTPFELAVRLFPRHYRGQIFLVMSEVIGHLDVLVARGVVELEERQGVEVARLAPKTPEGA